MKTNLTNWLATLCAILLVVALVLQTKQKSEIETLRQEHQAFASAAEQRQQESRDAISKLTGQVAAIGTNLESRLTQSQQQANEKLNETANMLQQNTAVMHRALGKVIPVELPASLTNKLAALEARIGNTNAWPKNSAEADALAAELKNEMRQIPRWAEEDLLPQLNRLRWAVQSFQVLQANVAVTNEDWETAATAYADQLSIQPDDGSTNLAALLEARQTEAADRFEEFQQNQEVVETKRQLTNFMISANSDLARATNEPTATLRQIALGRLLDNVISQRQALIENSNVDDQARHDLTELALRVQKTIEAEANVEIDRKSREYQRWALSRIKRFNSCMDRDDHGGIGYPAIEQQMVTELLPISVELLDPAVSRLYWGAFDKGWEHLGRAGYNNQYQTQVAEQEAVVQKHKP